MSQNDFKPGQKWISSAEPDLGIGSIVSVESRLITIQFDLVEEVRTYAKQGAPLTRVKFNVGDHIKTLDRVELWVEHVTERDGILIYRGKYGSTDTSIIETELDPNVTFSKPEERLFTNQTDDNRWFNLRYATLTQQARLAQLPVRGLLSPRVSLIPHQFYIANEVASRYEPRILLADEVGLGKTIEAGLIINQLLTTGRANRILIIVPPTIAFQWFVEMIRRFNLQFTLLDEERCVQIEADNMREFEDDLPELENPFEAQQLAICSLDLFLDNPDRLRQATYAEWDMIVVDEAHHLKWTEGEPGEDYLIVETIAKEAKGLLLLTATPEQLGRLGHFSRLKLLDSFRYHDYEAFLKEESDYEDVAQLITNISDNKLTLDDNKRTAINQLLGYEAPNDAALVRSLIDRHGTGRVLFRNVRDSVSGFPGRQLVQHQLNPESFPKKNASGWRIEDARTQWVIDLLKELAEKVLLICAEAETAIGLERHIRDKTTIRSTVFHEGMDLVARDRAANYFADEEGGAQVLICSEIGSEGRNFQFAHQLIMFDLPPSPDLIEQRIGRLDRIGQNQVVVIHVPYASASEQHLLLRIYDEGLGLFSGPNAAAQLIFNEIADRDPSNTDQIVRHIREVSATRRTELSRGRDRLIELNSHNPDISAVLLDQIRKEDKAEDLENYLEDSFELFGLESEPLSEHVNLVRPTEGMARHNPVSAETQNRYRYPEIPDEGIAYTYDRDTALAREDVQFITWENPLTQQAMELVSSNLTGNSSFIVVKKTGVQAGTILLETIHVVECVAPTYFDAPKYLPPSVVRSMVTVGGFDLADRFPFQNWSATLDIDHETKAKILTQQEREIRQLIGHANNAAEGKFKPIKLQALDKMTSHLDDEIGRLKALAKVNPSIRKEEIDFMIDRRDHLAGAINKSQIRLDAVRLILVA